MKLCIPRLNRSILLLAVATIAACGGANEPNASPPTPSIKAIVPAPAKKTTTVKGGNGVVIHMYQALYGMAPSNALLIDYAFQANNDTSLFAKNLTDRFATSNHADLAKQVLDNIGVTATTVPAVNAKSESEYTLLLDAVTQIFGLFPTMRGQVILNMTNLLAGLEGDATYGGAAIAYNKQATNHFSNTATYSVPTDIAKIVYPGSYQTPTTLTSDINTDPCNLNLSVVTYPQSWLGSHPLPATYGAPLRSSIIRAMSIKDTGTHNNPAFVLEGAPDATNGCKGDLQFEIQKTVNKLKALGVDYVVVPQWHWGSVNLDGSWTIKKAEECFGSLWDEDLAFFANAIHAAGMKIIMQNQIQGMIDDSFNAYRPADTLENYQKWFSAYQAYIVERATYFQSIGIDVWEIGCGACMFGDQGDGSVDAVSIFSQEYIKTLANMRKAFSGKTIMYGVNWLYKLPELLDKVDFIGVGIWFNPFTESESSTVTVESFKAVIQNEGWVSNISFLDKFQKSILINIGVQSRTNALMLPGYLEEAGCVGNMGDLQASSSNCVQKGMQPDFSLQAIVYEASMEIINSLPISSNVMVLAGDYWKTDSLIPQTAFPNLANSPRNKPAEGILKVWFAR